MTLQQIKDAVDSGATVYWASEAYTVTKDSLGQYLIRPTAGGSCIGLTWANGITLNGNESEFYTL